MQYFRPIRDCGEQSRHRVVASTITQPLEETVVQGRDASALLAQGVGFSGTNLVTPRRQHGFLTSWGG